MKKILNVFFYILIFLCIFNCGDEAQNFNYLLTVDGYGDNFIGYYKIDGTYIENFVGEEKYIPYYYFESGIDKFNSIKVFTFKNSEKCSLTISIWKDDREVASITSGENEGYDESTNTYKLAVGPLYYEHKIEIIENPEEEPEGK